jgi:hypothetical protein
MKWFHTTTHFKNKRVNNDSCPDDSDHSEHQNTGPDPDDPDLINGARVLPKIRAIPARRQTPLAAAALRRGGVVLIIIVRMTAARAVDMALLRVVGVIMGMIMAAIFIMHMAVPVVVTMGAIGPVHVAVLMIVVVVVTVIAVRTMDMTVAMRVAGAKQEIRPAAGTRRHGRRPLQHFLDPVAHGIDMAPPAAKSNSPEAVPRQIFCRQPPDNHLNRRGFSVSLVCSRFLRGWVGASVLCHLSGLQVVRPFRRRGIPGEPARPCCGPKINVNIFL